mgnify:CR=1 FL=1
MDGSIDSFYLNYWFWSYFNAVVFKHNFYMNDMNELITKKLD